MADRSQTMKTSSSSSSFSINHAVASSSSTSSTSPPVSGRIFGNAIAIAKGQPSALSDEQDHGQQEHGQQDLFSKKLLQRGDDIIFATADYATQLLLDPWTAWRIYKHPKNKIEQDANYVRQINLKNMTSMIGDVYRRRFLSLWKWWEPYGIVPIMNQAQRWRNYISYITRALMCSSVIIKKSQCLGEVVSCVIIS